MNLKKICYSSKSKSKCISINPIQSKLTFCIFEYSNRNRNYCVTLLILIVIDIEIHFNYHPWYLILNVLVHSAPHSLDFFFFNIVSLFSAYIGKLHGQREEIEWIFKLLSRL